MGAGGGKEVTGGQQLERRAGGEAAGQCDSGGGAEEAKVDAVHAEAGGLRGHDQVTGAGKLAACSGGHTLHPGDDRLGQGGDLLHDGGAAVEQGLELRAACVMGGPVGLHFLQVVPGGEGLTLGGKDDDANAVVEGEVGEAVLQRHKHGGGERVQTVWGGKGDGGDPVLDLASDQAVGHCIPPRLRTV